MINSQKRAEQRSCNCRNSKCMKLYCECFSARVVCGRSCNCMDCQNTLSYRQSFLADKRISREQLIRAHKGCACRRSGCTKKYCECFQSGLLCKETCKCVDCQNNESLTNRRVINQLRKNTSDGSHLESSVNLYPLYLFQNSEHLHSIIAQSNPLNLEENWLQNCAKTLYESGRNGNVSLILDKLIEILSELEQNIIEQQHFSLQEQEVSQQMEDEAKDMRMGQPTKKIKREKENEVEIKRQEVKEIQRENQKVVSQDEENNEDKVQQNVQNTIKQESQQQNIEKGQENSLKKQELEQEKSG